MTFLVVVQTPMYRLTPVIIVITHVQPIVARVVVAVVRRVPFVDMMEVMLIPVGTNKKPPVRGFFIFLGYI
jgi:hypothetical protein